MQSSLVFQYVLNPTYSKDQIEQLDKNEKMVRAYDSTLYLPGKAHRSPRGSLTDVSVR